MRERQTHGDRDRQSKIQREPDNREKTREADRD